MDVSIILVNYNTKQLTLECLQSIYERTSGFEFEIFVVDNKSSDGSADAIEKEFPQVNLIRNTENRGFGAANNIAIKQASGRYIFLLNTDTSLMHNAIKVLFDYLENNKNVAVCGGNLFDKKLEYSHSFGFLKIPKDHILRCFGLRYLGRKCKDNLNREVLQEVEQIIGANMMIRKSVLDEVGLFDERFFLYFEESELQHRIQKAGYKIYYVPDAYIFHFEGASTGKNKKLRRQIISQSEYLYFCLCFNEMPKICLRAMCTLPQLYRFFSAPVHTFKALKYIWSK